MVGSIAKGLGVSVDNSGVQHLWIMVRCPWLKRVETSVGRGVGWAGHA